MRRGVAFLVGLCALLCLGAGPALAASSPSTSSPFSLGIPQSSASTPTTTSAPLITTVGSTSAGSGSAFSGGGIAAIAVGALVILGGIAFYIWYDARKRAPVRARTALSGAGVPGSGKPGSKQRVKPRKLSPAERRRRKRGRARR
jgi:predicted lipid-binding transport protein (Tim44 family)